MRILLQIHTQLIHSMYLLCISFGAESSGNNVLLKCEKKYLSNFNMHKNQLGVLLKTDSDSVNLGWNLRFFISTKLPSGDGSGL